MSVALASASGVRVHRAPLLDPPLDGESPDTTYRPRPAPRPATRTLPPEAIAGASPECHTAAHRFLNICLELFNGFRSPAQLRPLMRIADAHILLDELARGLRCIAGWQRRHRAPVRRRQLRTCEPRPGVAEVAAVLSDGRRTWSIAYRLEREHGRWQCTAVTVLVPDAGHA